MGRFTTLKVSKEQKEQIAKRYYEEKTEDLAREFGLTKKQVQNIANRYKKEGQTKPHSGIPHPQTMPQIQKIIVPKQPLTVEKAETEKKTMIIITSDVELLKKLIGEL